MFTWKLLRFVYNNMSSTFEELLIQEKSRNNHHKNFHLLVTEMYKGYGGIALDSLNNIFTRKNVT